VSKPKESELHQNFTHFTTTRQSRVLSPLFGVTAGPFPLQRSLGPWRYDEPRALAGESVYVILGSFDAFIGMPRQRATC
jgi:hypothetical protein